MELTLGLFFGVNIGLILQLGEGNELLGWSCRLAQFSAIIPSIKSRPHSNYDAMPSMEKKEKKGQSQPMQ